MWPNQFHQNQEETSQIRSNQTHYSLPNPNSDQICQSYIDSTELDEINTLNKNRTIPTTSFPPQDFYSHPSFPLNPTLSQSHISSTHYYQTEYQSNLNNPSHSPSNELSTSNNSYDPFAQTSQYEWSYLPDSYSQYTNLVETPPSLPSSSLPSSPISPSPLPSPATIVKNNLTLAATNNNKLPKIMPYRSDATGFVTKLYWLLENVEEFGNCIKWDTKGKAFLVDISNQQFLEEILPDLFRHKSVTSFNRQLQTYDFKRLSTADVDFSFTSMASSSTSSMNKSNWRAYSHPYMRCGKEENLKLLHPRKSKARINKKKAQNIVDSEKT